MKEENVKEVVELAVQMLLENPEYNRLQEESKIRKEADSKKMKCRSVFSLISMALLFACIINIVSGADSIMKMIDSLALLGLYTVAFVATVLICSYIDSKATREINNISMGGDEDDCNKSESYKNGVFGDGKK